MQMLTYVTVVWKPELIDWYPSAIWILECHSNADPIPADSSGIQMAFQYWTIWQPYCNSLFEYMTSLFLDPHCISRYWKRTIFKNLMRNCWEWQKLRLLWPWLCIIFILLFINIPKLKIGEKCFQMSRKCRLNEKGVSLIPTCSKL